MSVVKLHPSIAIIPGIQKVIEIPGEDYVEVRTDLGGGRWHVSRYDSEGRFHCRKKPAYEDSSGCFSWYRHGQLHREDGPAQRLYLGQGKTTLEWWIQGSKHKSSTQVD